MSRFKMQEALLHLVFVHSEMSRSLGRLGLRLDATMPTEVENSEGTDVAYSIHVHSEFAKEVDDRSGTGREREE